jgi:hypothetical protein
MYGSIWWAGRRVVHQEPVDTHASAASENGCTAQLMNNVTTMPRQ